MIWIRSRIRAATMMHVRFIIATTLLGMGCGFGDHCLDATGFATRTQVAAVTFDGDRVLAAMTRYEHDRDGETPTRQDQLVTIDASGAVSAPVDVGVQAPLQHFGDLAPRVLLTNGAQAILSTTVDTIDTSLTTLSALTATVVVDGRPQGATLAIAPQAYAWGADFDGTNFEIAWLEPDGAGARVRIRSVGEGGALGPVIDTNIETEVPDVASWTDVRVHAAGAGRVVVVAARYRGPVDVVAVANSVVTPPQPVVIPVNGPGVGWQGCQLQTSPSAVVEGRLEVFVCGASQDVPVVVYPLDPAALALPPSVLLDQSFDYMSAIVGEAPDHLVVRLAPDGVARLWPDFTLTGFTAPDVPMYTGWARGPDGWAEGTSVPLPDDPSSDETLGGAATLVTFDGDGASTTTELARDEDPYQGKDCYGGT